MLRVCALALLSAACSSAALQLHVKAGPDGRSVGDCPFAHAIRIVAGAKALNVELRPHSPSGKPKWLLEGYDGKMPCLVDGENVVVESRVVADFLDERYPAVRS